MIDVPLTRSRAPGLYWRAAIPLLAIVVGAAAVVSPVTALAGVVGLVFVAVAFYELAAAVAIFTLMIFLERLPGFHGSEITAIKAAGVVLAVAWLADVAANRARIPLLPREHPLVSYAAVALVLLAGASMLWAADAAVAQSSALRLAQGPLLVAIVVSALREPRHIYWVLAAYLVGAVLTAAIGIGRTPRDDADVGRLSGGIADPNELAAALLPAIPIALFGMAVVSRPLLRWVLVVCLLVTSAALFMTGSRGGLIGMGVMFVAGIALAGPWRQRVVAGVMVVTAVAFAYYTLVAPPQVLGRITNFSAEGGSGRTDIWSIALEMYRDHPVLGIGAGNFPVLEPTYALSVVNVSRVDLIFDTPKVAHNTYLGVLVELGVGGLACLAIVLAGSFLVGLRGLRSFVHSGTRDMEILARGFLIGTTGMLASYTFVSGQYEKQLWLVVGIALALDGVARRTAQDTPGAAPSPRGDFALSPS